jgi:hypothetical protein
MKTMGKLAVILAGVLMVALVSCADPFRSGTGEDIPDGMGLARIHLSVRGSAQSVRTVVPDMAAWYFTLEFTAPGETVSETMAPGSLTKTVALKPATWTLEVKGYTDSGHTPANLKVTGSITVTVNAGTSAAFDVSLAPNLGSGGTGTLSYSIGVPASVRAFLALYPVDDTPGTSHELDISSSAGGTASNTITGLAEGSYRAVLDFYKEADNTAAAWTGAVHIYDGLVTPLTFTPANFAECPPLVGTGQTTLAAKLDAALASPPGTYTIVLENTDTDLASFPPKTLNVTGSGNQYTIILRGNGKTVQVNALNTPLLTLEAATGSTLALELRDVTLKGMSGNTVPMARVNAQGTLNMRPGSLITGNSSSTSGGGVYVASNGTFAMSGGAVIGNSSSSFSTSTSGGGVYVNSGTFAMSGGAVTGNSSISSSTSSHGGGVYVASNGTFAMSGGTVTGNSTTSFASSSSGGGVYVNSGTFAMSGGAVTGNSTTTAYYSSSGGGVYVNNGTFAMSGGAVHSNTLSGTNYYGREVLVYGGTFRMSGEARPERVFLYNNARSITISGPLSGPVVPIDLGITSSAPLANYVNAPILKLDTTYDSGNLAELKAFFALGNSKYTASPWTETAITGYEISDEGKFVVE